MSPLIEKALEAITARTNVSTGLAHPNDMNAAKEMFVRLHREGEILLAEEIESWAIVNGWRPDHAAELGALGQQIGMGKPSRTEGEWWKEDIIEQFRSEIDES
ncbi:MAG: hypothetical protein OXH63_10030 [Gemmatimonadetes bacterium]|nr:hypothetical protein [Gemmatimonadota bacterium]